MKKKFMAGMLAMSIMFMGAGYAAWSQSFTVTNTVKTGELRFEYEVANPVAVESEYTSLDVIKNADGNIVGTIEKAYPGATYSYDIEMTNHSTMGVIPVFTVAEDPTEKFDKLKYSVDYKVDGVKYNTGDVVKPGQNLKAEVMIIVPTSANEDNFAENGKIEFENTFIFNQFNAKIAE